MRKRASCCTQLITERLDGLRLRPESRLLTTYIELLMQQKTLFSLALLLCCSLLGLTGCVTQGARPIIGDPTAELEGSVRTDRGIMVTFFNEVLFKVDSTRILPSGREAIEKVGTYLKAHPEEVVLIEGHTDDSGAADYNAVLSKRRAETVRKALILEDIEPSRITSRGYGESRPIADNDTPEGRAKNRRVEITIMAAE